MSRACVLLSGEGTSLPEAEARAVFRTYDPNTTFRTPEPRLLIAEGLAPLDRVAGRLAYTRRVGLLLESPRDIPGLVGDSSIRLTAFQVVSGRPALDPASFLEGVEVTVDLEHPEFEATVVRGTSDYLILGRPGQLNQRWSLRRPRKRPFFHPSAIFPKLSRALVNLARCREGGLFLDPFAGTGSLLLEASLVGLRAVALDQSRAMAEGCLRNMRAFQQNWLGVVRADTTCAPLRLADGIATDLPYGRASSTRKRSPQLLADCSIGELAGLLSPGGRLVVMHPETVKVESAKHLIVEEEHRLYVHSKLTRVITVMRRT